MARVINEALHRAMRRTKALQMSGNAEMNFAAVCDIWSDYLADTMLSLGPQVQHMAESEAGPWLARAALQIIDEITGQASLEKLQPDPGNWLYQAKRDAPRGLLEQSLAKEDHLLFRMHRQEARQTFAQKAEQTIGRILLEFCLSIENSLHGTEPRMSATDLSPADSLAAEKSINRSPEQVTEGQIQTPRGESTQPAREILRASESLKPDAVTSALTPVGDYKLVETQQELAARRWAWLEPLWKDNGITSDEQWASLAREQTTGSTIDRNTARDWRLGKTPHPHLSTRKALAKPLSKTDLLL